MAKKKKRSYGFVIFMVLYIAAFCGAAYFGLTKLWDFMEAYEVSRPQKPVQAYMNQLTPEHICDLSGDVIAQIDHNIQSEEECRKILMEAVSGPISYARNIKESTDEKTVYMLLCGGKTIGSFTTTAQAADEYGLSIWEVTEEEFDLSYLIGEPMTVSAPSNYTVLINGQALSSDYLTGEKELYPLLDPYYEDYPELPYSVSYTAGPFLGELGCTVTDPEGNAVTIDDDTDWNLFACTCTADETAQINDLLQKFVENYVAYTASKETRYARYHDAVVYALPGSNLAVRMRYALDGLKYNRIRSAELQAITVHYLVPLDDTHYLCDITYETLVDKGEGKYNEINNVRLGVVKTDDGLKVESMTNY